MDWGRVRVNFKNSVKQNLPKRVLAARQYYKRKDIAAKAGLELVADRTFYELKKGPKTLRVSCNHWIYFEHMVESFDYYFDSVAAVSINGSLVVDMSTPRYHDLVGFDDFPLFFPSHIEPYVTTAQYLNFANLQEGSTVLDIGAYAGVTSIIFSKLVGKTGSVFAFEADQCNQASALRNIQRAQRVWGLSNVELIAKAVWSHSNGIEFSNEGAMGSSAVAITGSDRGSVTTVPSVTLLDFCNCYSLAKLDFVKIDIEGGEIEVLASSKDALRHFHPRIVVEPHSVHGEMSTDKCSRILKEIGYEVIQIEQFGSSVPLVAGFPREE